MPTKNLSKVRPNMVGIWFWFNAMRLPALPRQHVCQLQTDKF